MPMLSPCPAGSPSIESIGLAEFSGSELPEFPLYPVGYNTTPYIAGSGTHTLSNESDSIRVEDYHPGPLDLPHEPTTVFFYAGVISPASSSLFDLLRTKWLRQLIRPLASGLLIESYHQESMAMAMSTPFYMHSLLACCGAEYPVDDVNAREHFWQLSRKHYVRAITGLREALGASEPKIHKQAILRTVLMLCIFEVSSYCSTSQTSTNNRAFE
jgi:hypothetical protein